jgi:hypothetical protein
VAVLSQSTWDTFGVLMPIYGTAHGFSASVIGMVLGVFSIATLVIRLLLPVLSRHLKPWQMLLISLLLTLNSASLPQILQIITIATAYINHLFAM